MANFVSNENASKVEISLKQKMITKKGNTKCITGKNAASDLHPLHIVFCRTVLSIIYMYNNNKQKKKICKNDTKTYEKKDVAYFSLVNRFILFSFCFSSFVGVDLIL